MHTHILTRILRLPFVRQLFGAAAGALIALAAYTAYRGAQDAVRAYLIPPGADRTAYTGEVSVADKTVRENEEEFARITARARRTAQLLRANQQDLLRAESGEPAPVADASASEEVRPAAQERMAAAEQAAVSEAAASSVSAARLHAGAPTLPSSGLGLWMAVCGALGASFVSTRRLRMLLLPARGRVD